MAKRDPKKIARALLDRHGQTYAEQAGISLANRPQPLFELLVLALLLSARIRASIAVDATRALFDKGWTSPQAMASARWRDRTRVLNRSGYARYDERTSSMLEDTSKMLIERYDGDLRRLRDEAQRDPAEMRRALKSFKGIGDVGVDIFFREVQSVWPEVAPFVDKRAVTGAGRVRLPRDPRTLSSLVPRRQLPRFVAALVRVSLEKDEREILDAAA